MSDEQIIQLHFSAQEKDIWDKLQSVPEEERSAWVLAALRQSPAYVGLNESSFFKPKSDFDLEQLFVQPEGKSTSEKEPWHQFLSEIIGEEEDEDIIALINNTPLSKDEPETVLSEQYYFVENAEDKTANYFSKGNVGLDYILNHIIGQETDEAVINFLQQGHQK